MSRAVWEHPLGYPPPAEWFEPGRRVTSTELNAWLSSTKPPSNPLRTEGDSVKQKRRHKMGAKPGFREDLGFSVKSQLEANFARYLKFTGFQLWTDKESQPPAEGRWFAYEWREFALEDRNKRGELRGLEQYKPDFHLWEDGLYSVVETKGHFDQRSKRKIRLMLKNYPDIGYKVVTAKDLDQLAEEALYRTRRHGPMVIEIPGWE